MVSKLYAQQCQRVREKDEEVLELIQKGELVVDTAQGVVSFADGKPLTLRSNPRGYLRAYYSKEPLKYHMVHRIILLAHVGLSSIANAEVDHINSCKIDNRAENLRWVSRSDNCVRKPTDGVRRGGQKAVLTDSQVVELRQLRAMGWSYGKLAKHFGISHLSAKTWAQPYKLPVVKGKLYRLRSPSGQIYCGINIAKFARLMNLCALSLQKACKYGQPYKGWVPLPLAP